MPLKKGSSREVIQANIKELIEAGHSPSQSAAIAYKDAGVAKDSESAREYDDYGFMEIQGNPISKVGVFPYLGAQIGAPEADRIYMVYRPEEELNNPATIDSFKLVPFINEHPSTLLGNKDGLTTTDQKRIEGVTGEQVYFEYPYLKANLKVFSSDTLQSIDYGKEEVSAGYRCQWVPESGIFEGVEYQYTQRNIRGNHNALVEEGRSGPDVSVMDSMTFSIDSKELKMAEETQAAGEEKEMTLSEVSAVLKKIMPHIAELEKFKDKLKPLEEEEHGTSLDESEKEEEKKDGEAKDESEEEKDKKEAEEEKKEKGEGMDTAAEIKALKAEIAKLKSKPAMDSGAVMADMAKKADLVARVSQHIGTFACDSMTHKQVAEYAAEKLGLDKTHAVIAVESYLKAKPAANVGMALDTAAEKSTGAAFLSEQFK